MVSIRDTKKFARKISLKNADDKLVFYYPLDRVWKKGNYDSCERYIEFNINGERRILDTKNGGWYDDKFSLLPTKIQQGIYPVIIHLIESQNPSIRELHEHQRKNITSMILRSMHGFGNSDS